MQYEPVSSNSDTSSMFESVEQDEAQHLLHADRH